MNQSSTIVFFGSGPVAAATLQGLLDAGLKFEAIITKPRAEGHRGSVPVLELAAAHNLQVFTPTRKTELSQLFAEHKFKSQVGLVVDYGIIIAKDVIDSFPKGIINSHFSLLPEWRGADPITFSILSGQATTGVSLMLINERLDEGDLLSQQTLSLKPDITTPELTQQLITISNSMIIRDLPKYLSGDIIPYPQPTQPSPTYSRKLTKEDSKLDLTKPADQLEREVRAFIGWPKSKITVFGHPIIVTQAKVADGLHDNALVLPASNNTFLEITQLIAPSGRTMDGQAFLRGYKK
ncbi:MAG TPA: methionyl-tRNA formyltransferase [Candidatus Saccharimonadales bacterium]|nr:methionyl-tRNA formyltransferase [Candidatus Saccharimonadales bacterium]